jgi:hypothetical protein
VGVPTRQLQHPIHEGDLMNIYEQEIARIQALIEEDEYRRSLSLWQKFLMWLRGGH